MKAVVLAAGEGARLSPLTDRRPKPMLPVGNRPLLEHVIEAVTEAGVDEIVLVIGYKRDRIQSYFGDGDAWGVSIEYAEQDKQLGTGHAVAQAKPYVTEDFLVVNGDRILEPDLIGDVATKRQKTGEAILAVTTVEEPSLYGVVDIDSQNTIVNITEKPPTYAIDANLINAGVYGLGPEIFDAIEATTTVGELALTDVLTGAHFPTQLRAHRYDGPWFDVSRPWDLIRVNGMLVDENTPVDPPTSVELESSSVVSEVSVLGANTRIYPNASVMRGTAIGENVRIGANATVENSIIMDDARIGAGSVIRDAVIGENATIGANTTIPGGRADIILEGREFTDVTCGGIVGDNTTVGAATLIDPGSIVGNDCRIEGGTTLHGRIASDSTVRRG